MKSLIKNGGISVEPNREHHLFMPLIISASCDLPAKADVQGLIGHSGRFACGYCLNPGVAIKASTDKKSTIRYLADDFELRTHEQFITAYQNHKSLKMKSIENGIRKVSCFVAVDDFDLADSFALEHMHFGELGVMQKLFDLWLNPSNHKNPYYIKRKDQILLSKRILSIKPVCEISRKPRSIFARNEFKANEFRSMLLFYLPFALEGLLERRYVEHFRLFSSAMYVLLKEKISDDEIEKADMKLNQFVSEFEILYGKNMVTMNVHLTKHTAPLVRKLRLRCFLKQALFKIPNF